MRTYPAPLRVLLDTQFGVFLAGNGLSLIGTWMQRIACSWLIWDWTHSAFWLGILSAGDLLPSVVVGPFAGVAADRWDRLRQNMLAQAVSAVLAALTAVLLATGHLGLVGMVLLITAQGTLSAAIQPARLAMVQQMVARADMGTAVALNSVSVNLTRLLGPAVAGAMILHMDVVWIFVANAAVTAAFVLILARLRLAPHARGGRGHGLFGEMAEGVVHILRVRPLRLILLAMLCGGAMVRAMIELIPAIAAGKFVNDATGLAVLSGAAAFGAVASGLTAGRGRTAHLLQDVLLWWGLGAVAAIVLTWSQGPVPAVAAAVAIGFAITRGLVSTQTFVQLTTPDALRGRVLSMHGLIARGSPALGALVIGFAADRIGLARAVEVSSVALIVLCVALVPQARSVSASVEEAA
ncbi:MFS transporter [Telluria mixta]|uniref:MFS transporter n=1 Tax=Telluria mixta TaxID=34071 RepID=A0ABT2C2W3_9BURK|nr:MFS transporter [Telluria mixta]MCS0631171.1 MFS transporter [Telluria mixta]WEM95712.1 MFS transporter [Telluria mixta]